MLVAFYSKLETLTIGLLAPRFLASASSSVLQSLTFSIDKGRWLFNFYLKRLRITFQNTLSCFLNLVFVWFNVKAYRTTTLCPTFITFGEAFAVHFKTLSSWTVANLLLLRFIQILHFILTLSERQCRRILRTNNLLLCNYFSRLFLFAYRFARDKTFLELFIIYFSHNHLDFILTSLLGARLLTC